jgi:hypothetical protein
MNWHGRDTVDLLTDLIDREIVDPDHLPVGRVDDIELREVDGEWQVTALLTGTVALERRLPRWARRLIGTAAKSTGGPDEVRRIPIEAVTDLDTVVSITRDAARAAASPAEERIRRKVIAKIPGAGDASG